MRISEKEVLKDASTAVKLAGQLMKLLASLENALQSAIELGGNNCRMFH